MKTVSITFNKTRATYLISDEVLVTTEQDMLELIGETNSDAIILHDHNFEPDFFDLSTRKLGDVFQKCENYQVKLAIIGDFTKYPSKVLPSFIAETNRQKNYIFVNSFEEIKTFWK